MSKKFDGKAKSFGEFIPINSYAFLLLNKTGSKTNRLRYIAIIMCDLEIDIVSMHQK